MVKKEIRCDRMRVKKRKGQILRAREVVLLAVMTSFCVVANILCSHTIPLHAGTAMVVLTGISLGAGPGFFVGMLARFICNCFDGQGIWTPWEMISWGLLGAISGVSFSEVKRRTLLDQRKKEKWNWKKGIVQLETVFSIFICIVIAFCIAYLSYILFGKKEETFFGWRLYLFGVLGLLVGILFQKKKLPPKRIAMAVYTFLIVFILYGGIMNFASLCMQYMINPQENPLTWESLKVLYITGVPYDISHGVGAAVCVFVLGESLLQKLERIRVKYGIFYERRK